MTRHELKCWPPFFADVKRGSKPFEIRRNDRHFEAGDTLLLKEFRPDIFDGIYTGEEIEVEVSYVLFKHAGLAPGFVALGISRRSQGVQK